MEDTNLLAAIAELDRHISHALEVSARHPQHSILRQNIIELKDRRRHLQKQLKQEEAIHQERDGCTIPARS